jgi:DNA-directed RNA polymerase subunit N (RpoN/RPB10)
MSIPIRCFTCSKVIADKYSFYLKEVRKQKQAQGIRLDKIKYLTKEHISSDTMVETPESIVMDQLQLAICCRRHFLTHVEIH